MKKNEIDDLIEQRFRKIEKHFRKAIVNFETEEISGFRAEIKKLKVFFHLLSMESADGLSYRITKKIKTLYGYFGIIQNLQQQLKRTNIYAKESLAGIPVFYLDMLEKELAYWKNLSINFIDNDYDFRYDKEEILLTLPDKLTKKSIKRFLDYISYELNAVSERIDDDEALDTIRKFLEDIFYNYEIIVPFMTRQQINFFNPDSIENYLEYFADFHEKSIAIALLKTFDTSGLNLAEKKLLKEMENEWVGKKKDLKNKLIAILAAMNVQINCSKSLAIAGIVVN